MPSKMKWHFVLQLPPKEIQHVSDANAEQWVHGRDCFVSFYVQSLEYAYFGTIGE